MIDATAVENIKKHGVPSESGEARLAVLRDDIGFRMDQPAEYVIIGGCFQPEAMPGVLRAFKDVLERLNVDYTFLSKEYCCGWMPIGQPAVMMKNEDDIREFRDLSKQFIAGNFRQAEDLGAKTIALFCAACEPNYTNCKDDTALDFISYVELLDRHIESGKLDRKVDYYAGCYRFRRRITDTTIDTEPALRLLGKIDGLKVNQLDSTRCCYIPPHIEELTGSLTADTLVTICTGCYHNLRGMLEDNDRVMMLPELLAEAL